MTKRILLAIVMVFLVWTCLSMVLHGFVIGKQYNIPGLFRPEQEMNGWLALLVYAVQSASLVLVYALLVRGKSPAAGLSLGILWGLADGVSMGFGSYSAMPIPLSMAVAWCVGTLVIYAAAGLLAGLIVRPGKPGGAH